MKSLIIAYVVAAVKKKTWNRSDVIEKSLSTRITVCATADF